MTKEIKDEAGGGNHFLAGYGWQVLAAPLLGAVLLFTFFWFFGYDTDLLWTNVIVLAVWLILVLFVFLRRPHGEIWRNYGWIFSPAMLVVLILVNISWARSTLEIGALETFESTTINIPNSRVIVHAIYPQQIIYDEQNSATLTLWITNDHPCPQQSINISSDALFFALQPIDNSPLQWRESITTSLPVANDNLLVYIQPRVPAVDDTQEAIVTLNINNTGFQNLPPIRLEGRRGAQKRLWMNTFLDASSLSVIIGIVVAWIEVRRKEEEERRKKKEEINNALEEFNETMQNNLSAGIRNWEQLTKSWEKWDKVFQDLVRDKFGAFFTEDVLWDAVAGKTLEEMMNDVEECLKVCGRIFESEEAKPIITLKKIQSSLRHDEHSPRALLSMLKNSPASINIAKIIAAAFPPDLKRKTIACKDEFPEQIRALRGELDFSEMESFPLQTQFVFSAKESSAADQLTAWLTAHGLNCSPFADADSPFYSVFDKQLLMAWAAPGFALPAPSLPKAGFEFENSWDAGAALFAYCNTLQSNVRVKENMFFVIVTPSLVENYGADHPKRLYLHALAEQWIWSLAESPTLFYSLKGMQRELTGRLLRWHDFSPSITVNKISEIARYLQEKKKEKEISRSFGSNIMDWLAQMSAEDLRIEEINALIGLRPSPKQHTVFLISAVDLNPRVEKQITPALHEQLDAHSAWLSVHHCGLVHFQTSDKGGQTVSPSSLIAQCNIRVQKCSKDGIVFNQLFDAPGEEPDAVLAAKANGSPGRMVRLGQTLLLRHVEKYPLDELLHIEDLEALEV